MYEYYTERYNFYICELNILESHTDENHRFSTYLNSMSKRGWEVVAMNGCTEFGNSVRIVYKREINDDNCQGKSEYDDLLNEKSELKKISKTRDFYAYGNKPLKKLFKEGKITDKEYAIMLRHI